MKILRYLFLIPALVVLLHAQIDPTGEAYIDSGPAFFVGSFWEQFRNNTGATVDIQIWTTNSSGMSWAGIQGDPGIPTALAIPPDATFWLAVHCYGVGYSEERTIMGYSVVATEPPPPPPPPPPPVQFSLITSAGAGGSVSGGGMFNAGTVVTVTAWADAAHAFAGWSGDAGGMGNPLTLTMDRDWSVQANFAPLTFPLATSALPGGSVTPGGSYPFGTMVTVTAAPDALHYFTGWTGDAGGAAPSVSVFMDGAKSVQAVFAPKASQVITFANPGDQPVGATPVLSASSSAGLPVTLSVLSGPATLSGNSLTVTGSGPVVLQASQPGDATTLAASPVIIAFNGVSATAATIKYQLTARTILQDTRTASVNYVLSNP